MHVELILAVQEDPVESASDLTSRAINAEKPTQYRSSHPAADRFSVASVLVRVEQLNRGPSWIFDTRSTGGNFRSKVSGQVRPLEQNRVCENK